MNAPVAAAVRDVDVRYGPRSVFRGATLSLEPGTLTAIIGRNGSGKSSLLRVLAGIQRPTRGVVVLADRCMLIASSVDVPADVTPRSLADYGLALRRPWWRFAPSAADVAAVDRALERIGLADRADDAAVQLSAGEVQRAWIGAALAASATTVLIDEPTSHLDLRYQVEILERLRALAKSGVAIGAAVHDLTLAARFADVVALFADGTLRSGPPEEVLTQDALRAAYDVEVSVFRHPVDGYLVCLPGREAPASLTI